MMELLKQESGSLRKQKWREDGGISASKSGVTYCCCYMNNNLIAAHGRLDEDH